MKAILKSLWVIICAVTIFSCKKNGNGLEGPGNPGKPGPLITEPGKPIGNPVSETIGPAGGQIQSEDARITLKIPAGAVDENIAFSIQEVENTVGLSGIGKSYRLMPEGVTFKQDVEIIFYVPDTVLENGGTILEALRLVYQDKNGKWHAPKGSSSGENPNEISIKTKHFSDWTLSSFARIVNKGKDRLLPGESTELEAIVTPPADDELDIDDLLGPVIEEPVYWQEIPDAYGTLTENKSKAVYKAPSVIDEPVKISIKAYFRPDLVQMPPGTGRFYAYTNIQLLPDTYIMWQPDTHSYQASGSNLVGSWDESMGYTSFVINASDGIVSPKTVSIRLQDASIGVHPFSADVAARRCDVFTYFIDSQYSSYDYDCSSDVPPTQGAIVVTKKDAVYLEGFIEGKLKNSTKPCYNQDYINFKAQFRIKKTTY